jgi:cell division protein FtsN
VIGVTSLAAAEDIGKAGPVGLFLILSLLIVVFLLGRSMRTHLRRVPLEFPDQTPSATGAAHPGVPDGRVLEGEIIDRSEDDPDPAEPRPRPPDTSRSD